MGKTSISVKLLLPVLFFMINSCEYIHRPVDEDVVATALGEKLYVSDLENIVPKGTSPSDSLNIIRRYVDNWVRQQVFLDHARKTLSPEQMDFDKKIQGYKNSLTIYSLENHHITNNLDTVVKNSQIDEYYENHKGEFKLKDNIVKVSYVKIPRNAPDQNILRRLYRSSDPDDLIKLEEYCTQHAATFFIDINSWLLFNEILREVPIHAPNQETYLRYNQNIEITDEFYRYFLYIHEYRLKESISPVGFVTENIKNIILNRRKQELINKLRSDLYREAVKSSSFEIYI